jgi:hypothetical protein
MSVLLLPSSYKYKLFNKTTTKRVKQSRRRMEENAHCQDRYRNASSFWSIRGFPLLLVLEERSCITIYLPFALLSNTKKYYKNQLTTLNQNKVSLRLLGLMTCLKKGEPMVSFLDRIEKKEERKLVLSKLSIDCPL